MKKITIFGFFILFLGLIWSGHWYSTRVLETAFLDYVETQKSVDAEISYDSYKVQMGFFKSILTIKNPIVISPNSLITKTQVMGDLKVEARLLTPNSFSFSTDGSATTSWKTFKQGEIPVKVILQNVQGKSSLNEYGRLDQTTLSFGPTEVYDSKDAMPFLTTEKGTVIFRNKHEKKKLDFTLSTDPIKVSERVKTPFGDFIETFFIRVSVTDLEDGDTLKETFQNWYDASGTVEIKELTLKWGALNMTSNGTLSLDENIQPIIALASEIKDMNAVLLTLVEKKIISQKSLTLAQILIGALSQGGEEGTSQKFALTLQEGELSLGPVPIIRGLVIDWG